MSRHDFNFVFFKVFSRYRYNQGNSFIYPEDFDIRQWLLDLGFEQKADNLFIYNISDDVMINAWLWPESLWCSGDLEMAKKFLYDVCTQFGGKDCDKFR